MADGLDGFKLLIVEPLDHRQKPCGTPLVMVDKVQAGEGDLVYFTTGSEGAFAFDRRIDLLIDSCVTGIISAIDADNA